MTDARTFYERQYRGDKYSAGMDDREEWNSLDRFCEAFQLRASGKRVLEVGSGRGAFQNIVPSWIGVDLATAAGAFARKPFLTASATALPFRSNSFDATFSIAVLEHVPNPQRALEEIARVLRPGGVAYLAPAWHCRPWAAAGLHVRPWRELTWMERMEKATIPLRESLAFRALPTAAFRVLRELALQAGGELDFRYRRLRPNLEFFWCADSDACNSMDPHEMIAWFLSRGFRSPSHPDLLSRLMVRHGPVILQKPS